MHCGGVNIPQRYLLSTVVRCHETERDDEMSRIHEIRRARRNRAYTIAEDLAVIVERLAKENNQVTGLTVSAPLQKLRDITARKSDVEYGYVNESPDTWD